MLNKEKANKLFIELKSITEKYKADPTPTNKKLLAKHENLCVKEFDYIVRLGASKYKMFNNYPDLIQEGYIALMGALKTYKEERGDIFWWCHKYIDTKIYRKANKHFVVDIPLVKAKNIEIKSYNIDNSTTANTSSPDDIDMEDLYDSREKLSMLETAISSLEENQRRVIKNFLDQDLNKKLIRVEDKKHLKKSIINIKKFFKNH